MKGLCVLFVASVVAAQHRASAEVSEELDVDRVILALDAVANGHYGFRAVLDRVTAKPPFEVEQGFEFLVPFLDGTRAGPLATCVGSVDGAKWAVSIDRPDLGSGCTDSYYDGKRCAGIRHGAGHGFMRGYVDPGVGLAPWLWDQVALEPLSRLLAEARANGRLQVTSRNPSTPEEAGRWRLYRLTFRVPRLATELRVDCKVGPDAFQVQRVEHRRAGRRIALVQFGRFEQVADRSLPATFVYDSPFGLTRDEAGERRFIRYHWTVSYRGVGPDPANVLALASQAREFRSTNAFHTVVGIDEQIEAFVRQSEQRPLRELPRTAKVVPLTKTVWPSIDSWHRAFVADAGTVKRRDAVLFRSTRAAVAALAQLHGEPVTFAQLYRGAGGNALDADGAVRVLRGLGFAFCVRELDPEQRARLRDPFLLVVAPGKVGATATVFTNGRRDGLSWSLRHGTRAGVAALPTVRAQLVISEADRKQLGL